MTRLSATVAVLGALTLGLTACGGNDSSGPDGGSHPHGSTTTAAPTTTAPTTSFTVVEPPSEAPGGAHPQYSALGPASRTTCNEFKTLDTDAEKSLIEKVLAENPGSKLDGNPNLALGTAKLVCLAASQADKPVAVAIGIA
ncbi:hypothetical protein NDR87_28425 [Nocardia sp. CDC159]|uniref:DUF732 domain-containing protein n=1 Tax=Nocardia pulmonis TaxID=2951408 RepID=A0A9X2EDH3_9NOCA|nr:MULTISPECIES: hypothetical protein [Nocardia]MCM6777420.1 hypothetical protein [Nocardia pulmonis]MCM6790305.1 hypothetical protein [Nocardia sp. CDC159]